MFGDAHEPRHIPVRNPCPVGWLEPAPLLQLSELNLRVLQGGGSRVGILPDHEETMIRGICIRADGLCFGTLCFERGGAGQLSPVKSDSFAPEMIALGSPAMN
jgi:hypothetical protein